MEKLNNKMDLMGKAPIWKALITLGLPMMIGMMVNAIYNLADAYFVGGLGTSHTGAITIAFPLTQVIVGIGLLFGTGAASYIARLLGHNDKETANRVACSALYGALIVGTVLIVISFLFLNPILRLLGATSSILPHAMSYTRVILIASVFNIFNVTMNNIVTSEGAAKTTMYALLIGAVMNIILDPIFIYTFKLGITGAAIATAMSQLSTALIYFSYIHHKKSMFTFKVHHCCLSKAILKEIFKIGIPTMLFQFLTSLSIALISMKAKVYGDSVIAGMGDVTRVLSMGSLMVFGFIKGFQPIAGYNYGANQIDRLYKAIKTTVLWSTIFCMIYGMTLAFCSHTIMSLFTKNDEIMITMGEKALIANGLSFSFFGFYTVYSSLFLALGKAKEGLLLGACRQGICFVPLIFILPSFLGVNGVLYAQPIADILSFFIALCMGFLFNKALYRNAEL